MFEILGAKTNFFNFLFFGLDLFTFFSFLGLSFWLLYMTLFDPQLYVKKIIAKYKRSFFITITTYKDNRKYCLLIYLWYYNCTSIMDNEDFYMTQDGYKCFTEKYHLKRGYCCKSNCKHCPYGFNPKLH